MWHGVLLACREANPYLGIVALVLLGYRVGPTLFVLGWQTAIARTLWAGYILLTAIGAVVSQAVNSRVTSLTLGFTILHLSTITLMAFWDFGLARGVRDRDRDLAR